MCLSQMVSLACTQITWQIICEIKKALFLKWYINVFKSLLQSLYFIINAKYSPRMLYSIVF